jgi:hypothetical protein
VSIFFVRPSVFSLPVAAPYSNRYSDEGDQTRMAPEHVRLACNAATADIVMLVEQAQAACPHTRVLAANDFWSFQFPRPEA